MRVALAVLLLGLAAAGGAQASEVAADAGLLGARVDREDAPSCAAPVPTAGCFAGHDPGPGPGVGDDVVYVHQHVRRVELRSSGSLAAAPGATLDPAAMGVEHGLGPRLSQASGALHAAAPALASAPAGAAVDERGLHLRSPRPADGGGLRTSEFTWAWNDEEVGYQRQGLPDGVGPCCTDRATYLPDRGPCRPAASGEALGGCAVGPYRAAREVVVEATPAVVYGVRPGPLAVNPPTAGGPALPADAPPGSFPGEGEGAPRGTSVAAAETVPQAPLAFDGLLAQAATAGAPVEPAEERTEPPPGASPNPASFPLLLLGIAAGGAALLLLAGALYHRIARDRLLELPARRAILEAIAAEPGIRVGTLSRRLGLSYPTTERHVRRLALAGLVEARGDGQRRYFVAGQLPAPARAEVLEASAPAARAVLDHVRAAGPQDLPAVRRALGMSRSTASFAVARLARAGLVRAHREGRRLVVVPALPGASPLPGPLAAPSPAAAPTPT